jgi:glycosyltransferase involved in cell wall biosynthesis
MRIALITPGFGGDEQDEALPWLRHFVRALTRRHEVVVFSLRYPHRRGRYQAWGATVHAFGGALAGGWRRLPLLAQAALTIRQAHHQQPFDRLQGLWADEPGFLAVTLGRHLGVPAMVSVLGGELVGFPDLGYGGQLSRLNRLLVGQALRRADVVTVGSRGLGERVQGWGRVPRLWPLGVPTTLFNPAGEAMALAGAPCLLQVAALTPVKDQATLLRAVALLIRSFPGLHLHLVGDGPLLPSLRAQAAALGLAGRVHCHGAVAHERLPPFYRGADLLVISSRFESQALVALEAMACGCPVAGTRVGLLPELVPGDWLAGPGEPAELARALSAALQDEPRRVAVAQGLMVRVAAEFTLEAALARWETGWSGGGEGSISYSH